MDYYLVVAKPKPDRFPDLLGNEWQHWMSSLMI